MQKLVEAKWLQYIQYWTIGTKTLSDLIPISWESDWRQQWTILFLKIEFPCQNFSNKPDKVSACMTENFQCDFIIVSYELYLMNRFLFIRQLNHSTYYKNCVKEKQWKMYETNYNENVEDIHCGSMNLNLNISISTPLFVKLNFIFKHWCFAYDQIFYFLCFTFWLAGYNIYAEGTVEILLEIPYLYWW